MDGRGTDGRARIRRARIYTARCIGARRPVDYVRALCVCTRTQIAARICPRIQAGARGNLFESARKLKPCRCVWRCARKLSSNVLIQPKKPRAGGGMDSVAQGESRLRRASLLADQPTVHRGRRSLSRGITIHRPVCIAPASFYSFLPTAEKNYSSVSACYRAPGISLASFFLLLFGLFGAWNTGATAAYTQNRDSRYPRESLR